jgi:hypothetical protein
MLHSYNQSYITSGGQFSLQVAVTGNGEANNDTALSPGATNVQVVYTLVRSQIKSLCLSCTGDCTIKTNSSGSPADTITLVAGVPLFFPTNAAATAVGAIHSADVTSLYLSSTAGGTFSIRACLQQ